MHENHQSTNQSLPDNTTPETGNIQLLENELEINIEDMLRQVHKYLCRLSDSIELVLLFNSILYEREQNYQEKAADKQIKNLTCIAFSD